MPRKSDTIPIRNELLDRRVKLTSEEKREIRARWAEHGRRVKLGLLGEALSQRKLARAYGVSRRTIVFALYPHRRLANVKRRNERGGSKVYYDRLKPGEWAQTQREHRAYKKELYQRGLIGT